MCLFRSQGIWSVYHSKLTRHGKQPKLAAFFEAVGEAGPQIIIQLHAMSVQDEPIKVIQMISVPLSFVSLIWPFTAFDLMPTARNSCLQKVAIVSYNFCLISSRVSN